MSSDQPPVNTTPITRAASPFDEAPVEGSVVLRSSDHIDFYVNCGVLSLASPVFKSMFSLPQPRPIDGEPDPNPSVPVVDITEDGKTLRHLLLLCYPVNKPDLESLKDIVPVLKAAQKYEMEWPVTHLTRELIAVLPQSPLLVWAVASRSGMDVVVKRAADEIRDRAVSPQTAISAMEIMLRQEGTSEILEGVSAGQYYRLREYLCPPYLNAYPLEPKSHSPIVPQFAKSEKTPSDSHIPPSPCPPPDLIFECSDGRQVLTHQLVIALNSPALFTDTPRNDLDSHLPVHKVALHSRTLVDLLQVCYWGRHTLPSDFHRLAAMILATRRFAMSRLQEHIKGRWYERATHEPLEAYFVSSMYSLLDPDLIKDAAMKVLEQRLDGWYAQNMENATAASFHRLLDYYSACSSAVCLAFEEEVTRIQQDSMEDCNTLPSVKVYHRNKKHAYAQRPTPPIESTIRLRIKTYLQEIQNAIRIGTRGPFSDVPSNSFAAAITTKPQTKYFPLDGDDYEPEYDSDKYHHTYDHIDSSAEAEVEIQRILSVLKVEGNLRAAISNTIHGVFLEL